jgi:hypothetical protein
MTQLPSGDEGVRVINTTTQRLLYNPEKGTEWLRFRFNNAVEKAGVIRE